MKEAGIGRREFCVSVATVGGALALHLPGRLLAAPAGKSRVVLVRNVDVLDAYGKPKEAVLEQMMAQALTALTGQRTAREAWQSLLGPGDVVGIKSNEWKYIPTTTQLEHVLKRGVQSAGVPEASIGIDDRGVLKHPIFQRATALVNARPMRAHHWSGVGSLIKNYIMFVPDPPSYHGDSCADLGKLWHLPIVKGKTRLNVLSMLTPQFHGVGPHSFNPKYVWRYHGLLVGVDPVAVDSVGLRIILARRRAHFGDDRPLPVPAHHIQYADTRWHLGTADPAKIELVKLGYAKDLLL
ncbi:MAG: hypothetical protein HY906_22765 [Deltaproteobacteria bacterium]|nr:hypothetical protein [Deltaproteobacteria bacterium]